CSSVSQNWSRFIALLQSETVNHVTPLDETPLWVRTLGDYAVNVGMETLTASRHERHTTELARLRGARMARASETEKGKAWAENRIKNLTGQDTITARFMRQDD